MMNLFLMREAVASVALSHPEGHDCDTCKAAAGDKEAWLRVLVRQFELETQRKANPETEGREKR